MPAKASAAVMNIKGSGRISIHDLKEIFLSLSSNFITSFVIGQKKKLQNLPSTQFNQFLIIVVFLPRTKLCRSSQFQYQIKYFGQSQYKKQLIETTGIPIPDEKDVSRGSFLKREIGIILIDKAQKNWFFNSLLIQLIREDQYKSYVHMVQFQSINQNQENKFLN